MIINFKKNILPLIIDIFLILWSIYNIAKSRIEAIFYIVFLYFFVPVFIYFSIRTKYKMHNDANEWEKVFFLLGILLFILNLNGIKNILITNINIETYGDWILIISTFSLSFGAFILFLRIKEILQKVKMLYK